MSDESSHMRDDDGRMSAICTNVSLSSSPPARSGYISAETTFSFESWVLQSNMFMVSISSPKNDILNGSLYEYENMSTMAPLTANCPGSDTKSTLSNPLLKRASTMSSWLISSPTENFRRDSRIFEAVGTPSAKAEGYVTMTSLPSL